LIEDDGWEGNLIDGKVFQKAGEGGTSYVESVGMSGHFFVPEIVAGGFGKEILVFGLIHLLIVDQSLGIPVLTLPSPEYRKYFEYAIYGSVCWYFILLR
jgi:hypothetical protein